MSGDDEAVINYVIREKPVFGHTKTAAMGPLGEVGRKSPTLSAVDGVEASRKGQDANPKMRSNMYFPKQNKITKKMRKENRNVVHEKAKWQANRVGLSGIGRVKTKHAKDEAVVSQSWCIG